MTSPCGASAQPTPGPISSAAGRLAGEPGQIGGPFGQIFGGLPDQAEGLVHLLPPDPQAGQRVTGDVARRAVTASDGYPS